MVGSWGQLTDPVDALVQDILLAGITKQARVIRIVFAEPMRVFLDFGDACLEEMRPPAELRERLIATLLEMSGASAYSPGRIDLYIGNEPHCFDASWRRETLRLARVAAS